MATLGNSASSQTNIRLEARKAFSFMMLFRDSRGAYIDVTGCEVRIVMKKPPFDPEDFSDEDNLITNSTATLVEPTIGYVRFDLQATDLDDVGEFPFVITMTTDTDYPFVVVKGTIEILDNPEFASLTDTYVDGSSMQTLDVLLRGQNVIEVKVGSTLPPGTVSFTDADKENLDNLVESGALDLGTAAQKDVEFFAPALAGMPPTGPTGHILTKLSPASYHVGWTAPESIAGGVYLTVVNHGTYSTMEFLSVTDPLGAASAPDGFVPTADGAGHWAWEESAAVIGSADDIPDGTTKVMMLATERTKLTGLAPQVQTDWDATTGLSSILHKPNVALANHTHRFTDLDGAGIGAELPIDPPADDDVFIVRPEA